MAFDEAVPEKPNRICEICGKQIEYVKNENVQELTKGGPLYNLLYWKIIQHSECNEIIQSKEIEKFNQEALKTRFLESNISRHLLDQKTFDSFIVTNEMTKAYSVIRCWDPKDSWGVFLRGTTGCGKTHLLIAFARYWMERGISVYFDRLSDTLDNLRQSYDHGYNNEISKYKNVQILIWDDLGSEKPSEWVEEKMHQIIDYRINERLPTFFSSNCSIGDIKTRIHERIASRLKEAATVITIEGKDKRDELYAKREKEIALRIRDRGL